MTLEKKSRTQYVGQTLLKYAYVRYKQKAFQVLLVYQAHFPHAGEKPPYSALQPGMVYLKDSEIISWSSGGA